MAETKLGTTITMPKLGESVTEGTLGAWLKQVGEMVEKYEPMVEVTTDKVTAEIPAPVAGRIVAIIGGEGETIPVDGPICVIDEGGAEASGAGDIAPVAAVPQAESPASDSATPSVPVESSASNGGTRAPVDLADARARRDDLELLRIRSSPIVRRLAEEHDIDLATLHGSGVGGRVTKADIQSEIEQRRQLAMPDLETGASESRPARPITDAAPTPQPVTPPMAAPVYAQPMPPTQAASVQIMPGDEVIEASVMRRQIAEHMQRSVQTAPHVTVWMDADMSRVVRSRERHKEEFRQREGFSLTYVPFVMRVVVQALREHPNVNAAWDNGSIVLRKSVNVGIAVALEDGLIVPVIRGADEKNVVGLARAVNDLAERAREGKLSPDDVSGGTFTVNNPGTLGSLFSTPILVQPQAAILSMEAITKRAVVIDDAIAIRPMMNLSLSIDHRILDGLAATRFLAAVKQGLEHYPEDASIY